MSQVTITLTFANIAAAAGFLAMAAGATGNAAPTAVSLSAAPTPAPAHTPPTAAAAPAAAPATAPLDFDKDVLPALQAYAKKVPRDTFAALMAKFSVSKVPELKAKPETWAEIVATANA